MQASGMYGQSWKRLSTAATVSEGIHLISVIFLEVEILSLTCHWHLKREK